MFFDEVTKAASHTIHIVSLALDPKAWPSPAEEYDALRVSMTSYMKEGAIWTPCDFGATQEGYRQVDPLYRVCCKAPCKPGGWISHEPKMSEGFVKFPINQYFKNQHLLHFPEDDQELLLYSEGGHFAMHVDRNRGPGHVGTVLYVLPSLDMEGGRLEAQVDPMSDDLVDLGGDPGTNSAYVAYLPLDVPHRVTPILRGTRLVLKAAVFVAPTPSVCR